MRLRIGMGALLALAVVAAAPSVMRAERSDGPAVQQAGAVTPVAVEMVAPESVVVQLVAPLVALDSLERAGGYVVTGSLDRTPGLSATCHSHDTVAETLSPLNDSTASTRQRMRRHERIASRVSVHVRGTLAVAS